MGFSLLTCGVINDLNVLSLIRNFYVTYFDTSNHALLISILGKYGAPQRLCSEIKHMYNKSVVKIVVDNNYTYIDFKVGVKLLDIMAPVLFLFLMMAFSETLEDDWTALGLSKSKFTRK